MNAVAAAETFALLERAQQGDERACERMVSENSALIWSVARRYFGRGVEADDLYQLGCLGFIKAVKGFDLTYGTQFSTYAVPKIAGEIRRFLRDDGPIKVSRTYKERAVRIARARETLTARLGEEPTLTQLAAELDLPPEEIAQAELAAAEPESIQRPTGEDGLCLEQVLADPGQEDLFERLALRQALEQLAPKERRVILLRYFHGLTQQRIADLLGVSQVQVSRMEKRALGHLRENL